VNLMADIEKFSPRTGRIIGEDGETYNLVDLLQGGGTGGGSTVEFLFDNADPQDANGDDGDVALNTDSGDIFKKESGSWGKKGNLEGPKGKPGDKGKPGSDG